MQLTAAPDAPIAVLVGDEILEDRCHRLAVRVGGVLEAGVRAPSHTEGVVGGNVPVEHEAIVVRVGGVAFELLEWRSTRPGLRGDLCAFEFALRVLRQGHPETVRVRTCGYVVAETVVR